MSIERIPPEARPIPLPNFEEFDATVDVSAFQYDILISISHFENAFSLPPSLREICSLVKSPKSDKSPSTSVVKYHLQQLIEKGLLEKIFDDREKHSRNIRLNKDINFDLIFIDPNLDNS